MVSPLIPDTLVDPAKEIKQIYKSQDASRIDLVEAVEAHFRELLSPHDAFFQIPPLNVSHPPPNHRRRGLVRFMGMVQDTSSSPEVYLSVLEDGSCGGWGIYEETLLSQASDDNEAPAIDYTKLRERDSVWAVTLPGQTSWLEERVNGTDFPTSISSPPYNCPKRYKLPSDDAGAFGLYLKLYNNRSHLKPGELKTFVGIFDEQLEERDDESDKAKAGNVPTLHVIFIMDSPTTAPFDLHDLRTALPDGHRDLRDELIQWIANEGLGGDKQAATWVFLISLSKVRSRSPPILPPSLTLALFPDASPGSAPTPTIIHILNKILPTVATVPLTLENLNNKPFAPTSVEEDLHAGILQRPDGTTVVVTESGMTEGKVTEKGLKNLDVLQTAMATQTLSYAFPYSSFPFHIDLGFLVLTRGRKSAFLRTDSVLPLNSTMPADQLQKSLYKQEGDFSLPSPSKLQAFQDYIMACKRTIVSLTQDVGKHIEDEFVRLRRESTNKFSSEDLARRMSIAKLLSASLLEENMTKETWETARVLDAESERK